MLRLVLLGCFLMVAFAALAAAPRVTPLGTSPSATEVTQRVAGPPTVTDPQNRGASTRPFVYQPCRTMTWVPCQYTLTQQP
jgi:hypothetical protein